ncbi:MAG: PIN domain nuclease, partial [Enterococcus viikkiensis]
MQKRVLTVIVTIVGMSLGITLLPIAWLAIGYANNMWLNNSLTN